MVAAGVEEGGGEVGEVHPEGHDDRAGADGKCHPIAPILFFYH